jgi:DMSO reductase anchor subunit
MKCPYEVPQYSKRLGIVRKCDMCHQRLAVGEAPACAQACPTEAIRVTIVNQAAVRARFRPEAPASPRLVPLSAATGQRQALPDDLDLSIAPTCLRKSYEFLPDSPDPSLTLPTTRYLPASLADLSAADHAALRLEKPHWPLIVMLLLSQAAAGLFLTACFVGPNHAVFSSAIASGASFLAAGLIAATLHLGRPLKAWRAFLGWRTSWLSRELLALNAFATAALIAVCLRSMPALCQWFTLSSALLGLVAVFASAMVYVDTGRPAWTGRVTFPNFFGATLVLGTTLGALLLSGTSQSDLAVSFAGIALAARSGLFVWRRIEQRAAFRSPRGPLQLNGRIVHELLPWTARADAALFILAVLATFFALANQGEFRAIWTGIAALATFGAETVARYVYFVASASKRMPGGILA